jgi:Alpha galactosidase A/Alpha galactosidase C-terminal beta sandwich domain
MDTIQFTMRKTAFSLLVFVLSALSVFGQYKPTIYDTSTQATVDAHVQSLLPAGMITTSNLPGSQFTISNSVVSTYNTNVIVPSTGFDNPAFTNLAYWNNTLQAYTNTLGAFWYLSTNPSSPYWIANTNVNNANDFNWLYDNNTGGNVLTVTNGWETGTGISAGTVSYLLISTVTNLSVLTVNNQTNQTTANYAYASEFPIAPRQTIADAPYGGWQFYSLSIPENQASISNTMIAVQGAGLANMYNWMVIDYGWITNSSFNTITTNVFAADTTLFPSGIGYVINSINTNGFKSGLYYPGSGNYTLQTVGGVPTYVPATYFLLRNATNFVNWGVNMTFFDFMANTPYCDGQLIAPFRNLSLATNNPMRMIYNTDSLPFQPWMNAFDGVNAHHDGSPVNWTNITGIFFQTLPQLPYQGKGSWPDYNTFGFLGNSNLQWVATEMLDETPFSYFYNSTNWNASTNPGCYNILTNQPLYRIWKDKGGNVMIPISTNSSGMVFKRLLLNGDYSVLLLNLTATTNVLTFNMSDLGFDTNQTVNMYEVRWQTNLITSGSYSVSVYPTNAFMFRVSLTNNVNGVAYATSSTYSGFATNANYPANIITLTGNYIQPASDLLLSKTNGLTYSINTGNGSNILFTVTNSIYPAYWSLQINPTVSSNANMVILTNYTANTFYVAASGGLSAYFTNVINVPAWATKTFDIEVLNSTNSEVRFDHITSSQRLYEFNFNMTNAATGGGVQFSGGALSATPPNIVFTNLGNALFYVTNAGVITLILNTNDIDSQSLTNFTSGTQTNFNPAMNTLYTNTSGTIEIFVAWRTIAIESTGIGNATEALVVNGVTNLILNAVTAAGTVTGTTTNTPSAWSFNPGDAFRFIDLSSSIGSGDSTSVTPGIMVMLGNQTVTTGAQGNANFTGVATANNNTATPFLLTPIPNIANISLVVNAPAPTVSSVTFSVNTNNGRILLNLTTGAGPQSNNVVYVTINGIVPVSTNALTPEFFQYGTNLNGTSGFPERFTFLPSATTSNSITLITIGVPSVSTLYQGLIAP